MPSSANKSNYTCCLYSTDQETGSTGQSRKQGKNKVSSKQAEYPRDQNKTRGIDELCAFRGGLSRKIKKLSKINKSNSLLAFSRIVKFSKFALWPVCLICSLIAEGDEADISYSQMFPTSNQQVARCYYLCNRPGRLSMNTDTPRGSKHSWEYHP